MKKNSQWPTALWIISAFLVWIYAFRGFLTSKLELSSDALSYYDHTRYFIENLKNGIYPLWDPYWYSGSPNDFFLRRIGAFNPFYLIILILNSIGIPYTLSYLWFLALYYFSGAVAFYLLALRIYKDRFIAYAGFLILLFSALGTRLFDSYMMLVTVPLIWFFYFLLAFSQTPRKNFYLGMTLFLMILTGTYIPFYFLIIFSLFLLLFITIYFDKVPLILKRYIGFFKNNKIIVFLSLMVLVISFIPTINFFHDTARGQMVLPFRHGDMAVSHTLTVPHQTLDWGAVEDLMYSSFFSNLKLFKFAVVYVPFFAVILLVLGFIGRINRRVAMIFLLGLVLFCCIVPHGLPFYDFFYNHSFFLKYFRNLHFFIWFFLIPLFVLLALEHWNIFKEMITTDPRKQWSLLIYVIGVHLIAFIFVWWRNDAVVSTYLMIILSLIFWSMMVLKRIRTDFLGFLLLTMTILVQPLEAYHYFSIKASPHLTPYSYDFSYNSFILKNDRSAFNILPAKDTFYYSSGAYNSIYKMIPNYPLGKYLVYKIILVDRLETTDNAQAAAVLEKNFLSNDNSAILFDGPGNNIKLKGNDPHAPLKAQNINADSKRFKLLSFNANHLRFYLDIPYEKFVIYNDCYDPHWRVSINNVNVPLYEVNGAFKGTWVPAGKNIIEFSYGSWWQYALNILLSILALILLTGTIYYARTSNSMTES